MSLFTISRPMPLEAPVTIATLPGLGDSRFPSRKPRIWFANTSFVELISSPPNAILERVAMQQAHQKIGDSTIDHWQLVSIGCANSSICVVGFDPQFAVSLLGW